MGQPEIPAQRNPVQDYRDFLRAYLHEQPTFLNAEQQARGQYDPQRIQEQQLLQSLYGPTQYDQQLQALEQIDPESQGLRRQLFGEVSRDLSSGYQLPEDYSNELTNEFRGAQAARGNSLGTGNAAAEAAFKGQAALNLRQQHLQNAGNALAGPTPEQQMGFIQGVSPDRSSAYVNPNAGFQGVNIGQQGYQNALAQYQLLSQRGNPWGNAAGGAAQGALAGSQSGGWGALAGGIIGGLGGYFSDINSKKDIEYIGMSRMGLPVIKFSYKHIPGRFIGTIAQIVQQIVPEATFRLDGLLAVRYDMIDVPFYQIS